VIRLAGAENAVTSNGWPQYSLEAILESPPDLIVFPDRSVSTAILDRTFSSDARWRTLGVVKRRDWFAVDEDLFVRPGPRFPGAVKELGRIIDEWESRR
jgi:ABC-type hemin transport system substrate-binding protein